MRAHRPLALVQTSAELWGAAAARLAKRNIALQQLSSLAALRPGVSSRDGSAQPEPCGLEDFLRSGADGDVSLRKLRPGGEVAAFQEPEPEPEPFPWGAYDRACTAFIDSPLDQFVLLRRQFINRDGSRPQKHHEEKSSDANQHWKFVPSWELSTELLQVRQRFIEQNFSQLTHADKLVRQRKLENQAYTDALDRYNKLNEGFVQRGQIEHHSRLQQQMRKWHKPLTLAIKQEQADVERHLPSMDRQSYGPYITLLDAEVLAVITLHEVLSAVVGAGERGALFSRTALNIGKQAFMEVRAKQRDDEKKVFLERVRLERQGETTLKQQVLLGPDKFEQEQGKLTSKLARLDRRSMELEEKQKFARLEQWDSAVRVKLGGCLIGLMLGNVMIRDKQGRVKFAVEHDYVHNMDKTVLGILRAQDACLDLLKSDTKISSFVNTRQLPMIVPPKPWTDPDTGGYLHYPSFFMRVRHSQEHKQKLREVARQGALDEVFSGLNSLGNVRWEINRKIFTCINTMWEFGGGVADLIEREMEEEAPYPTMKGPEWLMPLTEAKQDEKNQLEIQWRRELRKTFKENRERHSLNCDTQLKLQVAKDFMHAAFFFPHNLDFRGRAYPIPPHLHHLGNDMCRGLLRFRDGKELGANGLYWLRLQVANLWGHDKLSNDERVLFVQQDENLAKVRAAAADPFGTQDAANRWWMETDTPFQLLAACMDLAEALNLPDPTKFVSHLTVHQDGSCNGLQHYAALARDIRGAEQVNLVPSDKPQDVYIGVAHLLGERDNHSTSIALTAPLCLCMSVRVTIVSLCYRRGQGEGRPKIGRCGAAESRRAGRGSH